MTEQEQTKRNLWNLSLVIGRPNGDMDLWDNFVISDIASKLGGELEMQGFTQTADLSTRTFSKHENLHLWVMHIQDPQEFYSQLTGCGYFIRDSSVREYNPKKPTLLRRSHIE
jgi:hypothetical protein